MMARRWLVTFDVRGTLLRVRGTAGQQYADAASRIGVRVAPDALEQSFLDAYRSIAKQHPNFGHGVRGHPEMRSRDWWCMVVNRAFEGAGASQAIGSRFPALFASLYDGFARHDAWEVYPDVRHVLESLTKDRHVLGVVSNFDERLDAILEGHGLHKYFSFVLASGVFGAGKPDARIYQEALHLAQPLMDGHVHRDARAASPSVLPTDTCGDGLCEDGQWDAPPLIDKHP
eukprot:Opistho-2@56608